MKKIIKRTIIGIATLLLLGLSACTKEELPILKPEITISFSNNKTLEYDNIYYELSKEGITFYTQDLIKEKVLVIRFFQGLDWACNVDFVKEEITFPNYSPIGNLYIEELNDENIKLKIKDGVVYPDTTHFNVIIDAKN